MKDFKELFETVKIEEKLTEENVKSFLKKEFSGDKEFEKLKKAAKKDEDKRPDFLDYIYNTVGEKKIDQLSKKMKMDLDKLAQEMLKG